jgi:hypothetical protein
MVDGDLSSMVFDRFGYSVGVVLKLEVCYPNPPQPGGDGFGSWKLIFGI